MPLMRIVRSPEDLEPAARHFNYELRMLFFSATQLAGWHASPPTMGDDDWKNLALESFLLHFRNLRAFLCPSLQAVSGDDILASDLLGESEARDIGAAAALSKDKKRLDKMLAHLSYSRKTYVEAQDYGWHTAEMEITLLDQLEVFFGLLSPTRRAWFPPAVALSKERARAEDDRTASKYFVTSTNVVQSNKPSTFINPK